MVAFQSDVARNIWTYGSRFMRFLRFQPKLGHAVSHYQPLSATVNAAKSAQNCPNLPKSAQR
jgi:hypothetical protein